VQLQNSNNETLLNPEFAERFELNDDYNADKGCFLVMNC